MKGLKNANNDFFACKLSLQIHSLIYISNPSNTIFESTLKCDVFGTLCS